MDPEETPPPAVTVVVPAFRASRHIREALDSVLAQTFSSFEVIVVNDGSPDTDELERTLAGYGRPIRYIKQENRGPGGARNTGIRHGRGEYVAFLDSDDAWLPRYLAEQMRILREDPGLDMVYSDALLFGDPSVLGRTFMQNSPSRGPVTFESFLRWDSHVVTSGVVARRQALIEAGLFDDGYAHAEDFDLWLRLAHRGGRITYHHQALARYRKSVGTLSTDLTRMNRSLTEILKKNARTLDLSPDQRDLITSKIGECEAFAELQFGKEQLVAGRYETARESLERAHAYYGSGPLKLMVLGLRLAPRLVGYLYGFRGRLFRRSM